MQLQRAEIGATHDSACVLHIALLGGFRVERAGTSVSDLSWRRRSAKRLTKLLATNPSHALHREQIFDILWPDADVDSARNSLAKALHAARRALEPERRPREHSSCLRSRDDMVLLDADQVLIDADAFQRLAQAALRLGTVTAYEAALAAYTGVLLPEDLYEDWPSERRDYLADLNIRLLVGMAEELEKNGGHRVAVDRLRTALHSDPLREDVHRRLMRVYDAMGDRGLALRQFEVCRDALRRELDVAPEPETTELYEQLIAGRAAPRRESTGGETERVCVTGAARDRAGEPAATTAAPFVGRDAALQELTEHLARAAEGSGSVVVVGGEAGVGKTRLVARFAVAAQQLGACVLGDAAHASSFPYGPFAAAVEGYVAARTDAERSELAHRYPSLGCLSPSAQSPAPLSLVTQDGSDAMHVRLSTEIARLLTDIAERQTVVLVLGDLDEAHPSSLGLLEYLANLARGRRWLVIATLRDETMLPGSAAMRTLTSMSYERPCSRVRLPRLDRHECDELVRTLLRGRALGSDFLDRMYALTGGNPLFVEELARRVSDRSDTPTTTLHSRDLGRDSLDTSPTVRAVVQKAIAQLGASACRVLELVTVAKSGVALENLRLAAAELEPPITNAELFDALDRLLATGMLIEDRGAYTTRHAIVGAVLLHDLPQHRRAQLAAALRVVARPRVSTRPMSWPRAHEAEVR